MARYPAQDDGLLVVLNKFIVFFEKKPIIMSLGSHNLAVHVMQTVSLRKGRMVDLYGPKNESVIH